MAPEQETSFPPSRKGKREASSSPDERGDKRGPMRPFSWCCKDIVRLERNTPPPAVQTSFNSGAWIGRGEGGGNSDVLSSSEKVKEKNTPENILIPLPSLLFLGKMSHQQSMIIAARGEPSEILTIFPSSSAASREGGGGEKKRKRKAETLIKTKVSQIHFILGYTRQRTKEGNLAVWSASSGRRRGGREGGKWAPA